MLRGKRGEDYRFAFNGMEADNEISGIGNTYTASFWQYDPRIGRRWNIDPVINEWESAYATFHNSPVSFADPEGLSPLLRAYRYAKKYIRDHEDDYGYTQPYLVMIDEDEVIVVTSSSSCEPVYGYYGCTEMIHKSFKRTWVGGIFKGIDKWLTSKKEKDIVTESNSDRKMPQIQMYHKPGWDFGSGDKADVSNDVDLQKSDDKNMNVINENHTEEDKNEDVDGDKKDKPIRYEYMHEDIGGFRKYEVKSAEDTAKFVDSIKKIGRIIKSKSEYIPPDEQ